MHRRIFKLLLVLVVLLIVVLMIVQAVLWTDFPRRIVLGLVQRELGMRVEAASLSTGWFGNTTLTDVRLSLPLADESFLDLPRMEVEHTALIPLLITRNMRIDAIELKSPILVARRDSQGRWNLLEVAELLIKATGGAAAEPGTPTRPPTLPKVRLTDGLVRVIELDGREARIEPLTITGDPDGPLVYRYEADVPERLKVRGDVSPGQDFLHRFAFAVAPGDWLTPWLQAAPGATAAAQPVAATTAPAAATAPATAPSVPTILARGEWRGAVGGEAVVSGQLTLDEARYEQFVATGDLAASVVGSQLIVSPQGLVLNTNVQLLPQVRLASGTVQVNGMQLTLEQVRAGVMGGDAQVDGSADLAARSADLRAIWSDLVAPGEMVHGGSLTLSVKNPFPGRPQVSATILTRGQVPEVDWSGEVQINGSGRDWENLDWTVRVPRVATTGRFPAEVENLTVQLAHRGSVISVRSVDWPGHQVFATAQYNLDDQTWSAQISGEETIETTLQFSLDARGDAKRVDLRAFNVAAEGLDLRASGAYVFHLPEPVDLKLNLTHTPGRAAGPTAANGGQGLVPISGRLFAEAHVKGTLEPRKLNATGEVRARQLAVFGRDVGDVEGKLLGTIDADAGVFATRDLALLGGRWHVEGTWPYDEPDKLTREANPLRVRITAEDVQLAELNDLLNAAGAAPAAATAGPAPATPRVIAPRDLPPAVAHPDDLPSRRLAGTGRGEWIIDLPVPRPERSAIGLSGEFRATDVSYGDDLRADDLLARTELRNGVFRVDPLELRREHAGIKGTATATVNTTVKDLTTATMLFKSDAWPIVLPEDGGTAALWAEANLTVRGETMSATGPFSARTILATAEQPLGEGTARGRLDGRVAMLDAISFDGLGGHAEGRGTFHVDNPQQTNLAFSWTGLQGERLADLIPQLEGLSGSFGGAATLAPSGSPRALEPLRLTLGLTPANARFRTVELGPMRLSAFLNLNQRFELERIVLDELPSESLASQQQEAEFTSQRVPLAQRPLGWNDLRIADGRVRVWARRGHHQAAVLDASRRGAEPSRRTDGSPREREISTHVIVTFDRLDADQLVHAIDPEAAAMPGRVSGQITLHGNPENLDEVFGQGSVQIRESDFGNVAPLALLYQAVRLGTAPPEPLGRGSLDLSLQASTLTLRNVRYFNRGVEARSAAVEVRDVWELPDSPLYGHVVGSARPLGGIRLPFLADADQILNVLQQDLTTVRVEGTVGAMNARIVPFGEAGDALRRLLVGDVRAQSGR